MQNKRKYYTKCETILQALQCNLCDVDWKSLFARFHVSGIIFPSAIFIKAERKTDRARDGQHAKNVRRLLTRCMYAIQNYLSHVPICSINWPIFHSRMYVRPVKSDNDEKITTVKLNKVTTPARSYATCERSFIGINE